MVMVTLSLPARAWMPQPSRTSVTGPGHRQQRRGQRHHQDRATGLVPAGRRCGDLFGPAVHDLRIADRHAHTDPQPCNPAKCAMLPRPDRDPDSCGDRHPAAVADQVEGRFAREDRPLRVAQVTPRDALVRTGWQQGGKMFRNMPRGAARGAAARRRRAPWTGQPGSAKRHLRAAMALYCGCRWPGTG